MIQQNLSDSKRTQKTSRSMTLAVAIISVMVISLAGPAQADWADQMGEGSGVDRGVMLAATSSSGSAQQQNMDTAALREAMASSLTSDLAGTLGAAGAMPTAYHMTGIVVPSIAASDGDDGMGDLG